MLARALLFGALAATLVAAGCGDAKVERGPAGGDPAPKAESTSAPSKHGSAQPASTQGSKLPTPDSVGVPPGWKPRETHTEDVYIEQPGAVVEDLLLRNANLFIGAENVTVRRVKFEGGRINNWPRDPCSNGLLVEDTTFEPLPGHKSGADSEAAIGIGGYTARRVKIWNRSEGFRVGGRTAGCGPVKIEDSFARITVPVAQCGLHADGVQGYDGDELTLRRVTIDFASKDCGTAPIFMPKGQGNTSVTIEDVLLIGGGYTFRLGVPATIRRLMIADRSWTYAPVDVSDCGAVTPWDTRLVEVGENYAVKGPGRPQPCA